MKAAGVAAGDAGADLQLDQALGSFIAASAAGRRGSALVVGVQHHRMLASAIRAASDSTAIAHSRRTAQAASAFVKREALACRIIFTAPADEPIAPDVLRSGAHYEAVVLDRLAPQPAPLAAWLLAGRQMLSSSGRLWLFERPETLTARDGCCSPAARAVARASG